MNFLLYFNAHDEAIKFTLPTSEYASALDVAISTAGDDAGGKPVQAGQTLKVPSKSLAVLEAHTGTRSRAGGVRVRIPCPVLAGSGSDMPVGKRIQGKAANGVIRPRVDSWTGCSPPSPGLSSAVCCHKYPHRIDAWRHGR